MTTLGAIAAVVLAYGLVSRRLERANVSAPMAFVAAGILLGPDVLGVVDDGLGSGPGLVFAEVALVLVLFSDAARIDLAHLRGQANLPARLLGIAMPLTIALGVAAGAVLLGGLALWEAAIVAAVLAPTDAALGQAVVSSERVPERIRQALNVESGLNDGLSVPFLAVFVALSVEESTPGASHWLAFTAEQIGYGALAGIAAGGAGGWLLEAATRRGLPDGTFQQLAVLALAVLAWALAGWVGGNGFIAAFVGGLAAGRTTATCGERLLDFTEDEGRLLNLAVFLLFGASAIGWLEDVAWEVVLYAALSLTVVRMLPVALALAGTDLRAVSVAFVGWFGPRGLASIILALVVVEEEGSLPGLSVILSAMTVTVLASVLAHGISARPLVRAYAARMAEHEPAGGPEWAPTEMSPVRGRPAEPV